MSNVVKDLFTFVAGATRSLTTAFLRFLPGYDKNSRFHFAAAASFTVFEHISKLLILYEIPKIILYRNMTFELFHHKKIGEDCQNLKMCS